MDVKTFLTLCGRFFETIGLSTSSITLIYVIRLVATLACNVSEQLPEIITGNYNQLNLFNYDFMNLSDVMYLCLFLVIGVVVRMMGTKIYSKSFISLVERILGYDQKQE